MTVPQTSQAPALRAAVAGLPAYVAGRKATSPNTAPLASNESYEPPLPGVVEAITAAATNVNRYPDMGATPVRLALADYLGVEPERVAVGAGSVAVLQQILQAVSGEGDEVMFAWRSFEAYPILVAIAGATAVRVPLLADESHDLAGMAAAVTDRTRVVLLCSPNNPTGIPLTSDQVAGFLASVPAHVLVVLDEAYLEYTDDPAGAASLALLEHFPNLCLLRTLSKAWGLAGLRVGYAIAHPDIAEGARRTAIPFGVSGVSQTAALAALQSPPLVRERAAKVAAERTRVIAALRSYGWVTTDSTGNFVWLRAGDELQKQLVEAFNAAEIMVRAYAVDGVRVSLADPASNDRVLAVLAERDRFGPQP